MRTTVLVAVAKRYRNVVNPGARAKVGHDGIGHDILFLSVTSFGSCLFLLDQSRAQRVDMAETNGTSGRVNGASSNVLCSVDEFVSRQYDFVIVGGGTAGLCVAARLTEDPNISVAVLEAGANRMDDPKVSTPALYPTMVSIVPCEIP